MCIATQTVTEAYQECQDRLVAAGHLIPLGVSGLYGYSGTFEDVLARFEQYVTRRAKPLKAEVVRFPMILNRKHYLKTTHIESFPDLMGSVHSFTGNERDHNRLLNKRAAGEDWTTELTPSEVMLTPAACYPLYPTATGTLPKEGRLVDLQSFVFRHEPSIDPARTQMFRQREFVRLGTPEQALEHRDYWHKLGMDILQNVGLDVESVIASDPFFGRGGKMMAATQKEQDLKFELVHPVATSEKPTAITSCNYHLDHFGHAFEIKTSGGEYAHTACIGFGLERIVLSLLMKHGFEPEQWPSDVKETLGL